MQSGLSGARPAAGTAGRLYISTDTQQIHRDTGSAWSLIGTGTGGSGTVTSVGTGTGLTGGPITTSGTLAVDVGTTANKVLQLNASAQIPAVSGALVTNLNASNLSTGTVAVARLPATIAYNGGNTVTADMSLGANANYGLSLRTNSTARMTITNAGRIGVGTTDPQTLLDVSGGSVVSRTNIVNSGAVVNLALANNHLLKSVGSSAILLQNPLDGGAYTLVIADTTSRTYTFSGCTNSYFNPANAATTAGTQSTYTILVVVDGGSTNCYVSWMSGFQ